MLFNLLVAMYHLGCDYHNGQTSQGYLMSCQASQYLWREFAHAVTLDDDMNLEQTKVYHKLREKYAHKL